VNLRTTFVANAQPTKLVQPGNGALNDPSMDAKTTAMFGVALGRNRLDAHAPQGLPMWLRVISSIALYSLGTPPRSAALASDRRDRFHQGQQRSDIMGIGTRQNGRQGNALRIRNEVVFAPRFRFVGWIRPCFFPPCKARTALLSTMARDQSICSAACN
jgi:hypothetical protein